jgi:SAM-dependent methyltransferase
VITDSVANYTRRSRLLVGKALVYLVEAINGRKAKSRAILSSLKKMEASPSAPSWDDYDLEFGTDTKENVSLFELNIESNNSIYGTNYQRSKPGSLKRVLQDLEVEYAKYVFVDVGCGKGLPLLAACECDFKKVVGLEFSPELCAIARRNVEIVGAKLGVTASVEVQCVDAVKWTFPPEPLVVYLFNPFKPPILRRFLKNLEDSYRSVPRDIVLIYLCLLYPDVLAEFEFLEHLKVEGQFSIYCAHRSIAVM